MSVDQRQDFNLYDNLVSTDLIPKQKIEREDLGILKKERKSIVPEEGSTTFGYSHQQYATFRWDFGAIEQLRDAKIRGKIALETGTKATIDGNMKALISQIQLKRKNGTGTLEQIDRVNRLRITDDLALESATVADAKWAEWGDCLYKSDSATAGTSSDANKRHIVAVAGDFEIYLADLINFPKRNDWHSYKQGGLELVLYFEKDKNVLVYNDSASTLAITSLYLDLPILQMSPAFYKEMLNEPMIQSFSGVKTYTATCSGSENHISLPVGVNSLSGVKIVFRDSATDNSTVGTDPASAVHRYISRSPNPQISSFQMRVGDLTVFDREVGAEERFYDLMKEFYATQHDKDQGSLLKVWNYSGITSMSATLDASLVATPCFQICVDLSKYGRGSGVPAKDQPLQIDISCPALTANLVYDIFCFYNKSEVSDENGEVRILM